MPVRSFPLTRQTALQSPWLPCSPLDPISAGFDDHDGSVILVEREFPVGGGKPPMAVLIDRLTDDAGIDYVPVRAERIRFRIAEADYQGGTTIVRVLQ